MKHNLLSLSICVMLAVFVNSSFTQNNNVLIEASAGTWCQWCPCGSTAIQQILNNYPNTMVLRYHWGAQDPFSNFNGYSIWGMLGLTSIPTAVIGRRTGTLSIVNQWSNQVAVQTNSIQPEISIDIIKSYNSETRMLSLTAKVTTLQQINYDCYINFVITENSIVYPQVGNSSCPGSQNWSHDWVTRSMVNGATGEFLSSGVWQQGVTLTKSWSTTLPSGWVDANSHINVFVYKNLPPMNSASYILQTKRQSITEPTGITKNNEAPAEYSLSQNYPNPFNPTTNIQFSIPKEGYVSLKVYDMTGSVVQTYVDGNIKPGTYNAEVDGTNLSSGFYLYTLSANGFTETKKMVLVK